MVGLAPTPDHFFKYLLILVEFNAVMTIWNLFLFVVPSFHNWVFLAPFSDSELTETKLNEQCLGHLQLWDSHLTFRDVNFCFPLPFRSPCALH